MINGDFGLEVLTRYVCVALRGGTAFGSSSSSIHFNQTG